MHDFERLRAAIADGKIISAKIEWNPILTGRSWVIHATRHDYFMAGCSGSDLDAAARSTLTTLGLEKDIPR